MAKFVWRLQRILDVKKKQEQATRLELLHLTEQVAQFRCQLMIQQQALSTVLENVAQAASQERMAQQALAMDFAKGSQARLKALEEQVAAVQTQKKAKTEALLELKRSSEGLERLRAAAERRFMEDQNRKEQKMADELSLLKHARCVMGPEVPRHPVRESYLEGTGRV